MGKQGYNTQVLWKTVTPYKRFTDNEKQLCAIYVHF